MQAIGPDRESQRREARRTADGHLQLLQPQQPGVIDPTAVANATAADALYVGALGRWKASMDAGEGIWNWEGLFTDEMRSVDTFTQRCADRIFERQ